MIGSAWWECLAISGIPMFLFVWMRRCLIVDQRWRKRTVERSGTRGSGENWYTTRNAEDMPHMAQS